MSPTTSSVVLPLGFLISVVIVAAVINVLAVEPAKIAVRMRLTFVRTLRGAAG
jgi:hypothetical protein